MATDLDPIVQSWYQHLDIGQKFRVVAVDEDEGVVEIQHYDGDIEEIDSEAWYEMDIEQIESPEDWTGPVDYVERDDMGYTETGMSKEDWISPSREIRSQDEWVTEEPADQDDWGEGFPKEEPWEGED